MNTLIRFTKPFAVIILIIALMFSTAIHASADRGPKPSIDLIVKNAPREEYIIDLLQTYRYIDYSQNYGVDEYYDHKLGEPRETMFRTLYEYKNDDGMIARIKVPVVGDSWCFAEGDGVFSYIYTTPKVFRVIIITESGQKYISEKINVRAFNSEVVYDVSTGKLSENLVFFIHPHIDVFWDTCIGTLFVEWLVLLFFKRYFRLKDGRNGKVFLLTNFVTQVFLYVMIQWVNDELYIPAEIAIVIIEAIVYSLLFRPTNKKKAVWYAVFANAASFVCGLPFWPIIIDIIR
ncbi:MAG: hypothetical protein K6B74_06435 [Ruminococcus sp.]|nr:hypothetical protein [Ruminococcus sp.]